jgi:uncharacterized repeat protein (TIGR03803 family)
VKTRIQNLFLLPALITGFGLMPAGPVAAQTFTVLHGFTNTAGGTYPYAGLALSANKLYGTTYSGGNNDKGAIFSIGANGGGFSVLYHYSQVLNNTNAGGAYPYAGLILSASNNALYGTAIAGGTNGSGTVFSVNTDGSNFKTVHAFAALDPTGITNVDGAFPSAGLVLSGDTLYGTASSGGTNGNGAIFSVSTNGGNFTLLHSFSGLDLTAGTNKDGAYPYAGLVLSGNTLFGTAFAGGTNGNGTIFSVSTNGSNFKSLHAFAALDQLTGTTNVDGASPYYGSLLLASNTLYGTTSAGGTNGNGTLFSLNTNGSNFKVLHAFTGLAANTNADGASPSATLLLSGNTLYGTAQLGGASGNGTVFSVNTNGGGFTVLHAFTKLNLKFITYTNADGAYPYAGLVLSGNTLYGTASAGGISGYGTVFSLPLPTVTISNIVRSINGSVTLNFIGFPGSTNQVQMATNLTPPVAWQTLSTNVAGTNGLWQFTDTNTSGSRMRFYRSITP